MRWETNSCLISLATDRNTASPMRSAGADLASDAFAEDGEPSRSTTAHELITDPVRAMQLVAAVRIFFMLASFK
jgi:hypothetical protein